MSNNIVIILISSLIILSFFFNMISRKTNIPSVLLLIAAGFGIRISPWFSQMGSAVDIFLTLNLLGVIGLIMIVLEAALDLKITRDKLPLILRAFFISLFLLFVTSGVVGYIIHRSAEIGFRDALLYSIPLSVMSSAIIIPSVARLNKNTKEFMIYESTFSDILGIIFFYMLLDWFQLSEFKAVLIETAGKIGITVVASIVVTFALTFLFQRLFNEINYFLIFAILLLIYAVGKEFHLSALILILIFGIMINNKAIFFKGIFNRFIDDTTYETILTNIKLFVKDTAFVIRTFFFFFFGLSIAPEAFLNLSTYYVVTLILVALYAIRYFNLKIFYHAKIFPVLFIAPRGLITILLLFSIPEHLIKDQFEGDITFMVIIATNLIMMFALMRQNILVKRGVIELPTDSEGELIENLDLEEEDEKDASSEVT